MKRKRAKDIENKTYIHMIIRLPSIVFTLRNQSHEIVYIHTETSRIHALCS